MSSEMSLSSSACSDIRRIIENSTKSIKDNVNQLNLGQDDTNDFLKTICDQNATIITLLTELNNNIKQINKQDGFKK